MLKNLIVGGVMFAVGWFGATALEQVGITFIGEDGEINWLLMAPAGVTFFVLGHYLGKIIK